MFKIYFDITDLHAITFTDNKLKEKLGSLCFSRFSQRIQYSNYKKMS